MSYKLVKITSYYRDYLNDYYSKNPSEPVKSYKEQYANLMSDCFAWSDFYKKNLDKIGVEAYEIVFNALPLQQAWARENNTVCGGRELVLKQLKQLKPDIVFFQDSYVFNGEWITKLRNEIPSIKKVIAWCCAPFTSQTIDAFRTFDFMLTCSPGFNDEFIRNGLKSFHLNHAFDRSILNKISTINQPSYDIILIGSLIAGRDYHNDRIAIVEDIINAGINIGLYTNLNIDSHIILRSKQVLYITNKLLKAAGLNKIIQRIDKFKKITNLTEFPRNNSYSKKIFPLIHKPVYASEMYNITSKAGSSLNIHGGVAGDYAVNMRLFEVTGVGCCLVTDWKKNLKDLFDVDNEIVSFKSKDECVEKIKWLRDNPSERDRIARAGQQRTLKDHSFEIRARQLDEIINKELKKI